ncbi:hypothetical protein [Streptomyces prunicolor]
MDGQSYDDYMFAGRDQNAFGLEIQIAGGEAQKQDIIAWFRTSKKYVIDNRPDLVQEVIDLPDEPPSC